MKILYVAANARRHAEGLSPLKPSVPIDVLASAFSLQKKERKKKKQPMGHNQWGGVLSHKENFNDRIIEE